MKTVQRLALLLTLAGAALAFQSALTRLGLPQPKLRELAENAVKYDSGSLPYLGHEPLVALRGMDQNARTQIVRELGPVVKALVMSPEFQKTYEAYIAKEQHAVNHGIAVPTQAQMMANPEKANNDAMSQAAAEMAKSFSQLPAEALKPMFEEDLKSFRAQAAQPGSEQAKYKKLYARAQQIAPLAASNPKEFSKAYGMLKSMEMGGPGDEATLNTTHAEGTRINEQRRYNELALKVVLKKRLGDFAARVREVDFAAQTTGAGRQRKFVRPDYERKPQLWKQLFRLGQAPAQAAAAFAEQWMKEL